MKSVGEFYIEGDVMFMNLNSFLCLLVFSVSGIISGFVILKFKLLKLTPIVLEKVFSSILDGVIILDCDNNIVDFNDSSKNIIPRLRYADAVGKKIDDVLKEYKTVLEAVISGSHKESLISIKSGEQLRYYRMNINNIHGNTDEALGKIIILNDVTEIELQRKKLSENLNLLQTLIDAIPNSIYSKDENGVYNQCNNAFAKALGITKEEIIGNTASEIYKDGCSEIYKEDKEIMKKERNKTYETKLTYNDGTSHDVIIRKSVVLDEYRRCKGVVGVLIDITEQKKNRERIDKLLKLKDVMINIGYCINEISNINDLLQLILDKVINCIDKESCGSILLLDQDNILKIAAAKGYNSEDIMSFAIRLEEHTAWHRDGENLYKTVIFNDLYKRKNINMLDSAEGKKIESVIRSPIIVDGKLYGFFNIDSVYNNFFNEGDLEVMEYTRNQVSIAITQHKLYEKTVYLSRYDKLTNVYNRSYLEQLLNDNVNNNTGKREFYLAVFDLNELKSVNDKYGHLAGDELIKTFSRELSSLAGAHDIIGRFGGDEFVGVFFDIDLQTITQRFENLIWKFKVSPIILGENKIVCSYSYGIVNFPLDGTEVDQLIRIADKRMYEYKCILKCKNK